MVYSKNISRKKDFKILEEIIDSNEYHPRNVTVKFDKNFFFYEVTISPGKGEDQSEIFHVGQSIFRKLYRAGFVFQEIFLRASSSTSISTWYIDDETKYKHLSFRYELKLVRIEELTKYFSRGSFY